MTAIRDEWVSDDGQHRLILVDCLDVLKELDASEIATVVTSPPYNTLPTKHNPSGIHAERKSGVNKWIAKAATGYADSRPEDEYQSWLVRVLGECVRLARGLVWVNHKVRYRNGVAIHPARFLPWPIYSEIIWDRMVSMALNCKRFAPSHETLLAFGRPHVWNDELNTAMSVWRIPFDRTDDDHPCAFPLLIADRPIRASTNPLDTILDPFAGSFTVAVACARTGRRYISIELDPRYFQIGIDRMKREAARHPLLEPQRLTQGSLL